jgi:hypothetical protein
MLVQAFVEGNLGAFLRAQAAAVEKGGGRALRRVTGGIRGQIRRDIGRASFAGGGKGLARAVRSRVRGKGADVEGIVYSKATYKASARRPGGPVDLVQLFGQGATIRAASGGWLAIPTENAWVKSGRGPRGQRMTPAEMIAAGAKLAFLPAGGGRMVAVIRHLGASFVTHVLVRQVSLRKRYDLQSAVDRWVGRMPEIMTDEINRAAEGSRVLERYGG